MFAIYRMPAIADHVRHHSISMPMGQWLPFLICLAVMGFASFGANLTGLLAGPRSGGGSDPQTGASLGARMVLGEKNPLLNGARAGMLRREYRQCQCAERGLSHALAVGDANGAAVWRVRVATVRSSYDLIALQSTDRVFAMTGLPRHD